MPTLPNREIRIAQQMQHDLMPSPARIGALESRYGLKIASFFSCSADLSGDFWGITPVNEEEIALYICDFSGHGVAAAINTFRFHALLEQQIEQFGGAAAYFMERLNKQMVSLLAADQFATTFYAVLHLGLDTLFYVAAGAPSPLMLRDAGSESPSIEWIDGTGLPIGIREKHRYPLQETPFPKGDVLLCYSDSLIEQPTCAGTLLSTDAIAELVLQTVQQKPENLPQAIIDSLLSPFRMADGSVIPFQDDLTLNVYSRSA
jgi:sigma-B regulation protein RsbU (phosphoserine phosphatase)